MSLCSLQSGCVIITWVLPCSCVNLAGTCHNELAHRLCESEVELTPCGSMATFMMLQIRYS